MPYSSYLRLENGIHSVPEKDLRTWGTWLHLESSCLDDESRSPHFSLRGVKRYVSLRFTRSWTSPIHGNAPSDLGNSQVQFLLGECEGGTYVLLLPVFDGDDRCTIGGDEEGFFFQFRGALPGSRTDRLRAALCTWGSDPFELIRQSIGHLTKNLNSFRTRAEKRKPRFTEYLGWCTWDAFYFDVSEKDILKGLQAFAKGGVQPGFVIIDDGWFDAEGLYYMKSFTENRTKLPNGLSGVVQRAKETYGVKHVGVWHALMAYWGGVQKNGPLSKRYRLIPNRGNVRPWDKTGAQQAFSRARPVQACHGSDGLSSENHRPVQTRRGRGSSGVHHAWQDNRTAAHERRLWRRATRVAAGEVSPYGGYPMAIRPALTLCHPQ